MALTLDEICKQVIDLSPEEQDIVAQVIARQRHAIQPSEQVDLSKVARERAASLATGRYTTRDAFEALNELEARHRTRTTS